MSSANILKDAELEVKTLKPVGPVTSKRLEGIGEYYFSQKEIEGNFS